MKPIARPTQPHAEPQNERQNGGGFDQTEARVAADSNDFPVQREIERHGQKQQ